MMMLYRSSSCSAAALAFYLLVAGTSASSVYGDDLFSRHLLPDHCEEITSKVPTPCPEPPPPKLPQMCSGILSKWNGDPHIQTFDGLKYDCMGQGEFTLLKSLDSDLLLQGRFSRFHPDRRPTSTTAIAFRTGDGEPVVQVSVNVNDGVAGGDCSPDVYIGGTKRTIAEGRTKIEGISIQKSGPKSYIFLYEESDVQLKLNVRGDVAPGCILDADVCIPDCYSRRDEDLLGLVGTPDGNPLNDWTSNTGITTFPYKTKQEYDYCVRNWCIREESDSIFTYEGGDDSFAKYLEGCDLPPYNDEDCVVDRSLIIEICGADNRECLVDGCVAGVDAAKEFVKSAINQVDRNCGKEIANEDFDGGFNYEEWGTKESSLAKKETSDVANAGTKTKYLSLHQDNSKLQRSFAIPEDTALVKLEYLFYEIGDWESVGHEADFLQIKLNDVVLQVGGFNGQGYDSSKEGVKEGIVWSINTITAQGDLGFGSNEEVAVCAPAWGQCAGKDYTGNTISEKCCPEHYHCNMITPFFGMCFFSPGAPGGGGGSVAPTDQIYKVTLVVPEHRFSATNSLDFEMSVMMTEEQENESAGVDNVRVVAFSDTCKVDCDGITMVYEDFETEEDLGGWGETSELADGHVILGPLAKDIVTVSKKFGVSAGAAYAKIEFLLYTMGPWTEYDSSEFWVNVGSVLFDVARFKDYETADFVRKGEAGDGAIKWERRPIADQARLSDNNGGQVHLVVMEVSSELFSSGFLTLGFKVEADDVIATAGIDDLRIRLFADKTKCDEAKKEEEERACPVKEEEEPVCYKDVVEEVCSPTKAPTPAPTPSPTSTKPPGSSGDPHFRTWGVNGTTFDFHGGCDLVLVSNDGFSSGLGFHTHIRTQISTWWSYIDSAVVKIGGDTLEVTGGTVNGGSYWINGQSGNNMENGVIASLSGFKVEQKLISQKQKNFRIDLGKGDAMSIETYKKFVRVNIKAQTDRWNGSGGMLGVYPTGERVARDGSTVIDDDVAFGKEWQVLETEAMLFHEVKGVQHPQECAMPSTDMAEKQSLRRRLGEAKVTREEAEEACAGAGADKQACVYDVLVTDDLDMAGTY